jgi:C-terminal processing protease CtpA/Prc
LITLRYGVLATDKVFNLPFRADPGAIVIGSTTAGADGNVSPIPLPGGLRTLISGIGVFYPDKTPTQQVGIIPNIEVKPTIEGIRAGRDERIKARQFQSDFAALQGQMADSYHAGLMSRETSSKRRIRKIHRLQNGQTIQD